LADARAGVFLAGDFFAAVVFFADDAFAVARAGDFFAEGFFADDFALARAGVFFAAADDDALLAREDDELFAREEDPLFAPDEDFFAPAGLFRAGALLDVAFAAAATASAASLVEALLVPLPSAVRRPAAGASPRFRERRTGRERGRLERTSRWVSSAIG
jgi:hypothetical protein